MSKCSPSNSREWTYTNTGVTDLDINPLLMNFMTARTALFNATIVIPNVCYPESIVRLHFIQENPVKPNYTFFKFRQHRAECDSDLNDWIIETAWALGARRILHSVLKEYRPHKEGPPTTIQKALMDVVMQNDVDPDMPLVDTRAICAGIEKHGGTYWYFDCRGPSWNHRPPGERSKVLAVDASMRPDGFRTLPLPEYIKNEVLAHPNHEFVEFADLYRDPKAPLLHLTGEPFPEPPNTVFNKNWFSFWKKRPK
jgi:hypothetical protein